MKVIQIIGLIIFFTSLKLLVITYAKVIIGTFKKG